MRRLSATTEPSSSSALSCSVACEGRVGRREQEAGARVVSRAILGHNCRNRRQVPSAVSAHLKHRSLLVVGLSRRHGVH